MKSKPTTEEKTEAPEPKRIALEHPKMTGKAHVWKKDLDAWLAKGWRRI